MINLSVKNQTLLVSNAGLLIGQPEIRLVADTAASTSTLSVSDSSGYSVGKWILIGSFGDSSAEIIRIHASTPPTVNTITLASATTKDHFSDSPITLLDYDYVEFSRASTLTGSKSVLATQSINEEQENSFYKDLTNTSGFAFARFKESIGATFSPYSTGVNYAGNGYLSVEYFVTKACSDASVEIGSDFSLETALLNDVNDCQNNITNTDWAFELVKDDTSLVASLYENTYDLANLTYALKYPGISQGVKSVKFGSASLVPIDNKAMDTLYYSTKRVVLATQAGVGATSMVFQNTSELTDVGVVYIGSLAINYSANDKTTNTLSGIDAGTITSIIAAGSIGWQGILPGLPTKYTVTVDNKIVFDRPVLDLYDGYPIRIEYLMSLPRFTDFSSTTMIPFPEVFPLYIAAKIEKRKRNFDNFKSMMTEFQSSLTQKQQVYKLQTFDEQPYYEFFDYPISTT